MKLLTAPLSVSAINSEMLNSPLRVRRLLNQFNSSKMDYSSDLKNSLLVITNACVAGCGLWFGYRWFSGFRGQCQGEALRADSCATFIGDRGTFNI